MFYVVFGLITVVVLFVMGLAAWAVIVNKQTFDPQGLLVGIGGLLGGLGGTLLGLGGYLFGDSRAMAFQQGQSQTIVTPQGATVTTSTSSSAIQSGAGNGNATKEVTQDRQQQVNAPTTQEGKPQETIQAGPGATGATENSGES